MSKLLLNTAKALLQYAKNKENETTRGGNNTALVSNNKGIPKLEKDIINTYENGNRNERQQTANLYNDVKNTMTENLLSALGQKDQARGRADAYTEDIRRTGGSLNPMNYNSLADYMLNAPYSAQAVLSNKAEDTLNKAYDKTNDKPWYKSSPLEYALGKTAGKLGFTGNRGTLTEEMKRAGLTQEDLDRWNKAENEKDRQNLLSDWAKNHKIGATLNAIPENAFGSMSGTIKKLGDYVKGNPIEERPTNADIYRQTVSDSIDSKLGKLAYGGANSIGDMLFATMLAAPLGAVAGGASAGSALSKLAPRAAAGVMGAEKANEVMNDAVLRGLTPDQIVAEGVGSGVTTALTEMLPFERFARGGNILGAMASEGLQEGAEDIADTILDELVTAAGRNQDKSTLHQNYNAYKEAGFSDEDALKNVIADYAKQVGTDTVMGGITGGLLGAGSNFMQGRNVITGKLPSLNENVNEDVNENIDNVNENIDNVKEEVKPEREIEALKQPEAKEDVSEKTPDLETLIQNNEEKIKRVSDNTGNINDTREARDIRELATQYKDKLSAFSKSDYKNEVKTLTKAIDIAIKSGDVNAIREALANADSVMQGAEVGVNARQFNKEAFQTMQNATDGYKIKVNPKDLADLNLGVKNVTELDRTFGQTGSNNRLHFVAPDNANGFYIDEVYDDIREKSGYTLPSSDGMNTTDMLNALMNYIKQPKAASDEMVNTRTWNDIGTDRPAEVNQAVDLGYDMLEKLYSNYYASDEEVSNAIGQVIDTLTEAANKNPEYRDYLEGTMMDIYNIKKELPKSTVEDVTKNVKTEKELESVLNDTIEKLNLEFFDEDSNREVNLNERGVKTGREKTSEAYTNTGLNSGMTKGEQSVHDYRDDMQIDEVSEEESMNEAYNNLNDRGEKAEASRLYKKTGWNEVDTDEAMILWGKLNDEIAIAEENGIDTAGMYEQAADLFKKIQSEATVHGAALQALAKWSRANKNGEITPMGMLAAGVRAATKAVQHIDTTQNLNADLKDKTFKKKFEFSKDFSKEFLAKANEYQKNKGNLDARQQQVEVARLAKMLKNEIPKTFLERFKSVLMDDMLFSIRTLISRNAGGNIGLAAVDQSITKLLAGGVDRLASRFTGTRTTTGFTGKGLMEYLKGFGEGFGQTASDYFKYDVNTARAGEENFEDLINNNGRLFKENNGNAILDKLAKGGNFLDRIVSFGLTIGDNPFYTAAYRQSLYEFDRLRNEGWFKGVSDEKFEKIKQAHSVVNALTAVYQNDSKLSKGFSKIKEGLAEATQDFIGVDLLSQAAMPFVKTPANVALTQIEYSPFGIAKNIVNTLNELAADHRRSKGKEIGNRTFNQQRFVRETSRNLVGTALYALAFGLAQKGLLSGAFDDDKDMAQAQREAGMQEYALKTGDNYTQVSWLPVVGSSAVSGAATWDAIKNSGGEITPEAIKEGLKAGAASQFENSMLQGVQKLFGTQSAYSSGGLLENATNTVKSAGTQLIPAMFRQVAAASDPYQRMQTGAGKNDKYVLPMIAAIPGLRQTLEPKIGRTGQELEQNAGRNTAQKWFDNLVNPAIVTNTTANEDPVRNEAMRLFDAIEDKKTARVAFQPYLQISDITTDTHTPSREEFTQYQKDVYGAQNQIAQQFINSDVYNELSEEDKAKNLDKIYSAVRDATRCQYLGNSVSDLDTDAKIYANEGADGLMNYIRATSVLNKFDITNNDNNREAVLNALESQTLPQITNTFETSTGKASTSIDSLMNGKYQTMLSSLSDENMEDLNKSINSVIDKVEFNRAINNNKEWEGAEKAYYTGGVNALAEYMFPAYVLKNSGLDNNDKNREMVLSSYQSGGMNGVQQSLDAGKVFEDTTYGDGLSYKYHHAQHYLPSLSPSQFATVYEEVDQQNKGDSGFNSITQKEVIEYLNKNPGKYNSETAMQYWNAFDTNAGTERQWKAIPVLNSQTGKWEIKKTK